jgi:transcriptional regulator
MYVPKAFAETDRESLLAFAREQPFATLVTHASPLSGEPIGEASALAISHLPLLVDSKGGRLRGHLARANPQFRHVEAGASAWAIFHGPHGYVSPSVYTGPGVPTWNYVVVHARGRLKLVDEVGLRAILDEAVAWFDASGWQIESIGDALPGKLAAIAGFEIEIEHLEGKYKLSQNRSPKDRARVVDWLERGDDASRKAAELMRRREG